MTKVYVDPTAIIDKNVKLGNGTKIWHFVHIMKDAKLGTNCTVADYVHIGKGVTIGNNVKLENRTTIYEGVTIENNVFVGPHVTFTNDLFPRSSNPDWKILSTLVKKGSSIGAGSVIICGITIGENTMIGASSTVTKDMPSHSLAYGNPARIRGFICKCGKKLLPIEQNDNHVLMKCVSCKISYKIPIKDYLAINME
ncbi:MAG: acyltransferase [Candidatus Bathyarchaeota archaeon]